ncbi:MAG: NACHT domain-containing protein [Anaerolineae bacterium]
MLLDRPDNRDQPPSPSSDDGQHPLPPVDIRLEIRDQLQPFSVDDLKETVFRLGLDWDEFGGGETIKSTRIINIVTYHWRHNSLPSLQAAMADFERDPLYRHTRPVSRERQNELNLIKRVRHDWIKDFLEDSLYQEARLPLGMEAQQDAVVRPWETLVQTSGSSPEPLPSSTQIATVFDDAGGSLLILGAPGAGKTTTMLDLAQDLLARAARDESSPLPVVFNLSSWAKKHKALTEWMADELNSRCGAPRKIAQGWLDDDHILPLLDGLDEVEAEHRAGCAEAINAFRQEHGFVPLVVCSRQAEYNDLVTRHEVKLTLGTAILLQPLTTSQVDGYLATLGDGVAGLRQALAADGTLRELADTPLMLSILLLTYVGQDSLAILESASQGSLFENYVQAMFSRRRKNDRYSREQTIHWLAWLARTMKRQSETVFYLEGIQPEWLPSRKTGRQYVLLDRLGWATAIALIIGFGLAPVFGLDARILGLLCGVVMLLFGSDIKSSNVRLSWMTRTRDAVIGWLVTGLLFGLIILLVSYRDSSPLAVPDSLLMGMVYGSFGALAGFLSGAPGIRPRRIAVVETVGSSRGSMLRSSLVSLPLCLGLGLIGGLLTRELSDFVLAGFLLGLAMAVVGGLVGGRIESRTEPNQGIRRSARVAAIVMMFSGLFVGLTWFALFRRGEVETAFVFAPVIMVIAGTAFGGYAVLSHNALRLLLWHEHCLPWRLVPFLDYAAERIFLRNVGGGYIFVHRNLQDYFASLDA